MAGSIVLKRKNIRHAEYYDVITLHDRLYAESKEGKTFDSLMKYIISDENIMLAYRNIKNNSGSLTSGVDYLTIADINALNGMDYIAKVRQKLAKYRPKAVRRVEIPKPNGKTRPLGIPTIWDRLIQQCILQVLEPICEAKFHPRNNGFRPLRSTESAMSQCSRLINISHMYYVVDIDIKGFFDNVNHNKLIKQIWNMGIHDKKLISIIKEILKAPIKMPNGEIIFPTKGTPQGGILSPLLSNIVLNELDWWIASQWETNPVIQHYKPSFTTKNGGTNQGHAYRAMRNTNLKEVYIVRYADDFKLFCQNLEDARKLYEATIQWLSDRLKLEVSEEKSKIVNLKQGKSEFLGLELTLKKKRDKFVLESHVSQKSLKRIKEELVNQIKYIQNPSDAKDEAFAVAMYNSKVIGIHNYYKFATCVNLDFNKVSREINIILHNRLGKRLGKNGTLNEGYIKSVYGKSAQLRFVGGIPLVPVGYVQFKSPMDVKLTDNKYTPEGRESIHKELQMDLSIMHALMRTHCGDRSIQFMDNRTSLYAAQHGKCAILRENLMLDDIHCHHKIPKALGGTDEYNNLVIVHEEVHRLIHATSKETIQKLLDSLKLDVQQIKKVNKLRELANLTKIPLKC